MSIVEEEIPPLEAGDFLSRAEFLRRWEAMPHIKKAELIRGVVYMPSPVSGEHARTDVILGAVLVGYAAHTPGCEPLSNATWLMLGDAPQPDKTLHILPEYRGQAAVKGRYVSGAPDFLAETCLSSTSFDLHQKLELYEEAGVQEYLAIVLRERDLRWHRLVAGKFELLPAPADGIYRSTIFPGLWLDGPALLAGDMAKVLAVLQLGIASPEHAAFVERLQRQRSS